MKKYHIITFGCQMNKSNSERISTILEKKNYRPVKNINEADLILVNMCSVRQSAVDRVFGLSQKLAKLKYQNSNLKTILTGCVLKEDKNKFRKIFDEIWDIKNYFNTMPKCQSKFLYFVPISNGCNNFCSYCVVPYTRGKLICREHKEILKETKKAIKKGYKEIWLLGQNVNDYHSPNNSSINFPKLLKMVNDIPGNFIIRFISPNPKNFSDELINVMARYQKVAKFLNLPVQSGDNQILKKMNRPYTVQQYKNLVKKIRKKIPDINLSTDVIVGFPDEVQSQFENTVKLFKEIKFDIAYISKYSPRPGTTAFKLKDNVPQREKERRWRILNDIILKNDK
jgi:tRNA-2-methylthio-N6-dimethylallyladenosine synthase